MNLPAPPPEVLACRGLSPAQRAELIRQAKKVAGPFVWGVKNRSAAAVQKATAELSRDGMAALAVVLAEALPPGDMRLAIITRTEDSEGRAA